MEILILKTNLIIFLHQRLYYSMTKTNILGFSVNVLMDFL